MTSYDVNYEDRHRVSVALHFDAVEPPVPLLSGAPPYPRAHHFDQTGRMTGRVVLDGQRIDVDCHAMRDRSWGPRAERGYQRVGYCWAADADVSFLTYSAPTDDSDDIYTGYLRRQGELAYLVSGRRRVERDPATNWVTAISLQGLLGTGTARRSPGHKPHDPPPRHRHLCVHRPALDRRRCHGARRGSGRVADTTVA